jgi:CRP-like cAMP-binding protein
VTDHPRSAAQHTDQVAQIARLLGRTFVFAGLQFADLIPLARRCRRRGLAPGEHVFFIGDTATHMYVVEHGQLKEYLSSSDGQETIIDIYAPPSVFGEPGLFAPERDRIINVAATRPSVVVEVPRAALVAFLHEHQPAMEGMLEGLASQARDAVHVIAGLAFDRIRDRLALKLAELAETNGAADPRGARINFKLSQGMLASAIAASRPNVNRAVRELVESGEIVVDGDDYIVTNAQRLRAATAPGRSALSRRNRRR